MQPAVTFTMASVGASIVGSGHLGDADVAGAVDRGGAHVAILQYRRRARASDVALSHM